MPKTYAFLGGVVLLAIFHSINTFAQPVSNLLGWALPAYLSVKAIESPGHNDDIQWLTYWVVFGFFNFTESFALRAVLYYFPWYFAFKSLFIMWLQLPAFRVSALFRVIIVIIAYLRCAACRGGRPDGRRSYSSSYILFYFNCGSIPDADDVNTGR